jgi:hypothetical protein
MVTLAPTAYATLVNNSIKDFAQNTWFKKIELEQNSGKIFQIAFHGDNKRISHQNFVWTWMCLSLHVIESFYYILGLHSENEIVYS